MSEIPLPHCLVVWRHFWSFKVTKPCSMFNFLRQPMFFFIMPTCQFHIHLPVNNICEKINQARTVSIYTMHVFLETMKLIWTQCKWDMIQHLAVFNCSNCYIWHTDKVHSPNRYVCYGETMQLRNLWNECPCVHTAYSNSHRCEQLLSCCECVKNKNLYSHLKEHMLVQRNMTFTRVR